MYLCSFESNLIAKIWYREDTQKATDLTQLLKIMYVCHKIQSIIKLLNIPTALSSKNIYIYR